MAGSSNILIRIAKPIVDFALPARCPACGEIVDGDDRFCLGCWEQLQHLDQGCMQCGDPAIALADSNSLCGACLSDPPAFDTMRAAVRYGDVARTIALRLKYGGRVGLARTVAAAMQRHMTGLGDALIVPVPLHRSRVWRRGYNQAALIARALAGENRERLALETLIRTRATPYLRAMSAKERAKTVRGAFAIGEKHGAAIRDRRVILIDDVYTSGATAKACAKVLKRGGATEVHVRCWARVALADDDVY
ncbi:ComF family protein [Parasphingopyxis lamellibrachiae]|uniref:ComF family protein n=1 Tax=Parasphingopyxis lamellibrachiae TaxID=680125 RepID=A0A3D9FDQ9_9SPHN|nr:ComF family protein [Parasphingopyxis lamellibrachiae]RED15919.1 ComF family protein [Parasphingopyxis lamellibrachiae]